MENRHNKKSFDNDMCINQAHKHDDQSWLPDNKVINIKVEEDDGYPD